MRGDPSPAEADGSNAFGSALILQEPQRCIYFPEDGYGMRKIFYQWMRALIYVCSAGLFYF